MSKVVREDNGNLSAILTLTIEKRDYEAKYKQALNAQRKKAHLRGFRKGKTPLAYIRKMYGQAILADVINDMLQNELTTYLQDEKLSILGQPLPAEDQEPLDFDVLQLNDFVFRFEIGLAPEFEVEGMSEDSSFERYAVQVDPEMVDKDMDQARKRLGERAEVENDIEANDMLTIDAEELTEADGELKENGWATTFDVLVDRIGNEELKNNVLTLKSGDSFAFNVMDIEKESTEEYVRKYILKVEEADSEVEIGNDFRGTIKAVTRVMPAELNQEFFDKYFGEGKVSSEEEARNLIEEEIVKYYDRQSESLLFRDFQDTLLEKNPLELPDAFLKRWLEASNENTTAEQIEQEYDNFAKNLQWSLLRNKIARKAEITISDDEIFEGFKDRVRNYFQGYGDELVILNTANRLMEDEGQVDQMYQELMGDKLFEYIRGIVKVDDNKIESKAFDDIIAKAREEAMARQNAAAAAAPAIDTAEETVDADSEETEQEVTEDVEQ